MHGHHLLLHLGKLSGAYLLYQGHGRGFAPLVVESFHGCWKLGHQGRDALLLEPALGQSRLGAGLALRHLELQELVWMVLLDVRPF